MFFLFFISYLDRNTPSLLRACVSKLLTLKLTELLPKYTAPYEPDTGTFTTSIIVESRVIPNKSFTLNEVILFMYLPTDEKLLQL